MSATKTSNRVLEAKRQLAERELARRRLLKFTTLTHPAYSPGWVHEDICARLEKFSREIAEGKSPRLMLLMPPRHGKRLADSTPVFTPQGWRAHGDLRAGDLVFHPSGAQIKVLSVNEPSPVDRLVTFFNGEQIKAHAEHEWTVFDRSNGTYRTVETQYLESQALTSGNRARFQLPQIGALRTEHAALSIDPYFLGAWLGDGKSSEPVICGTEQDLNHIIARSPYDLGARYVHPGTGVHYQTFVGGIRKLIREAGLLNNKHIPPEYLVASTVQRRALLAGLVDTDGSVEPRTQRVRFRTGDERLAEQVACLVRTFGYRASIDYTPVDTREREISGGPSWCVQWTPHDGKGGGTMPRKIVDRSRKRRAVGIKSIELCAPELGRCIQVDSPDGLYLAGKYMTPTHNSELASIRFPAWHLGHHPTHEIINVGYNHELPMRFSRKVREVLREPIYVKIFPDTKLSPDSQGVEAWNTTKGGGFTAAGVGGGITGKGAHCLPAGTQVLTTDGQVDIAHLYRLKSKPLVQTPVGPRQILAMTRREASEGHYVLRFASGATLQATGKHPLYLPDRGGYASVEELYGETKSDGGLGVRVERAVVPAPAVRPQQVDPVGVDGVLLQQGVQSGAPRGEERQAVRDMWQAGGGGLQEPQRDVLQQGLHPIQENPRAEDLPDVLRGVSAQVFTDGLLRGDLRKYGALDPYAWDGELELQGRQFLQLVVQPSPQARAGEGCAVRGLRSDTEAPLPSHRSRPEKQPGGESGHAVRDMSHRPPQVCYDTLAVVEYVCSGGVEVYDIQVEEAGCFFADSVLVGNCLIIDDPIKNQEEADSAQTRDKLWDWYQSTAYTRLAPGGGVLVIETWWNDDDLAGRLQQAMLRSPDADQFDVVRYPALSEQWEYRDEDTFNIHRFPEEIEDLSAPPLGLSNNLTLLRPKDFCLHEERYPTDALKRIRANMQPRIWSALYQQNPVPDEGMYFRRDYFQYRTQMPSVVGKRVYTAWDFAISTKTHNDWTVGATIMQDENDDLFVMDVYRFKGDTFEIVEAMLDIATRWSAMPGVSYMLGAEDGQIWRTLEPMLKKRMAERRLYPALEVLRPLTDKMARARPLQGRMQQGKVIFPKLAPWLGTAEQEMLRFPAGAHDDIVDALSWAVQLCIGKEPPKLTPHRQLASWKDKLDALLYGSGGSHMSA